MIQKWRGFPWNATEIGVDMTHNMARETVAPSVNYEPDYLCPIRSIPRNTLKNDKHHHSKKVMAQSHNYRLWSYNQLVTVFHGLKRIENRELVLNIVWINKKAITSLKYKCALAEICTEQKHDENQTIRYPSQVQIYSKTCSALNNPTVCLNN